MRVPHHALCLRSLLVATLVAAACIQPGLLAQTPAENKANGEPPKDSRSGVTKIANVIYAKVGERALPLDIYLPSEPASPARPVIIWIHGGGWKSGSKNEGVPVGFATHGGYAVVSVEYRLSEEALFPAQIFDCKAAVRWVRANASKYGFDPARIGVIGASAGGHLAALLGTSSGVKELEGDEGNAEVSSKVQAVCDVSGPTDLTALDAAREGRSSSVTLLLGGSPQEKPELARLANPINFVSKNDPPFYIVHGGKDPLVPVEQSRLLETALKKAGVSATLDFIEDAGHVPHDEPTRLRVLSFFVTIFGKP